MGREFVYAFDKEETFDEIWVIARREQRLQELQSECRNRIRPIPMDLSLRESIDAYRRLLAAETPEISVLVNAAGYGLFGVFREMDLEEQLGIIDLNSRSLTAMCHASIPYMSQGSRIINMASNSSWQPVPYINVYGASKAYVMSFTRSLGRELKDSGIQVMAVAPGWIRTEFFDRAVHDDTIRYYDRFYSAEQVIARAMHDLKRKKPVSILGFPVRMQVRLVKLLPVDWIMNIWCRQQGKK